MPFDLPTLIRTTALVFALSGVLLILLRTGRTWNAIRLWGVAMLTGGAGLAALGLDGVLPPPVPERVGQALLLLAPALSWTAARRFEERPARPVLLVLGAAVDLAVSTAAGGAPNGRGFLPFLIGGAYTGATAYELRRDTSEGEVLPARRWALPFLLFHMAFYLLWPVAALVARRHGFAPTDLLVLLVLQGLLHTIGMAFVLFALTTERAEAQTIAALAHDANHDALTNIGNRRLFDATIGREIRRAWREKSALGLLMMDIDRFKELNDQFGHAVGDECLRRVAAEVAGALRRPGDVVARFGGDELAVVLPGTTAEGALLVGEHICALVAGLAIEQPGTERGHVTISVGAAAVVPTDQAAATLALVEAADRALYAAKRAGGNTVRAAAVTHPAG